MDPVAAARLAGEVVDEIEKKWCPRCREWGIPHDRTGLCLWCDGPMQDHPAGDVGREETRTMTTTAATPATSTCKVDGCTNETLQRFGKYGGLCARHTAERKQDESSTAVAPSSTSSHTASVRALLKPAQALDKAATKLAKVPDGQKARAELAEAMRHVNASPTEANLDRLTRATKAMKAGQPRRVKLERDHAEALRAFKTAVGTLARQLAETT